MRIRERKAEGLRQGMGIKGGGFVLSWASGIARDWVEEAGLHESSVSHETSVGIYHAALSAS